MITIASPSKVKALTEAREVADRSNLSFSFQEMLK